MDLPGAGRPIEDVLADLVAKRAADARWADGRTFGLVYDGGPSVHEVAERAAAAFLHENALNTHAFPSLASIQSEVVAWTADLLHAPATAAGFLTSGGTESIQCAVLAARERGRAERGIANGTIVVAASAHAAFHKSAHQFGMPIVTVPVGDDWTADVDAMAARSTTRPCSSSARRRSTRRASSTRSPPSPSWRRASARGATSMPAWAGSCCRSRSCSAARCAPWDFRVDGVHSISADIHKLGYAPKGVSVIVHRSKELRRYQTLMFDDWLGGFYGSPNLQGTRSGAPMAAAWAVMQHLGLDGYVALTRQTLETADRMRAAVTATDGIRVLGDPRFHVFAMTSDPDSANPLDVFALGDALARRGWYHDRQGPPDSLHSTVSAGNAKAVEEWVKDLAEAVAEVRGAAADDRTTSYSTID